MAGAAAVTVTPRRLRAPMTTEMTPMTPTSCTTIHEALLWKVIAASISIATAAAKDSA